MAIHKVAQDVEADDKLIGPFSFRQFIYLIVVAMAGVLVWGLAQLPMPFSMTAILPLPIILVFGAMALPLKKDQPMEVYLAAIVAFRLKSRKRLWVPDGIESLVEITAPKNLEVSRVKDLSQDEAARRLGYLADIADSRGWSIRRVAEPAGNTSMVDDSWFEAQQAEDKFDTDSGLGQSLGTMITDADEKRRETLIAKMQSAVSEDTAPQTQSTVAPQPHTPLIDPSLLAQQPQLAPQQQPEQQATPLPPQPPAPTPETPPPVAPQAPVAPPPAQTGAVPQFNPYPHAIRQSVIQPLGQQPSTPPVASTPNPQTTTSENVISPDIINLANNTDLSVETIQREADRIRKKSESDEVYISLREN